MVTAGTYQKAHLLHTSARLTLVRDALFAIATEYHWQLQAWAILSNHYHFVAHSPAEPGTLTRVINKLHATTAKALNHEDAAPGRKVWFQYWDTRITFEPSLLARLRYVHTNPVHHGVAITAESYPWCSAAWLENHATPAFRQTLATFKTDHLSIPDDF
jgi:putative transposase